MIDTIKLMIPEGNFTIGDYELFTPSAKGFYEKPYHSKKIKCIYNTPKQYLSKGIYNPKLTLANIWNSEQKRELTLFIEFSIPKLLFGNNFSEITDDDIEKVFNALQNNLKSLNIHINLESLKKSKVVAIHYSKNIELNSCSSKFIVNILNNINVSKILDITKTDYKNDGIALRFHTNYYELAFYDKIADLRQSKISEKRAIEKDNVLQQGLLLNPLFDLKEVLRMELRLNNRKKIKIILEKCNLNTENINFENLLNKEFAKSMLRYYWSEYVSKSLPTLCLLEESTITLQEKMIQAGIKPTVRFTLLGIIEHVKTLGNKITKESLKTYNYSRFKKYFDLIDFNDTYVYRQLKYIENVINNMIPMSL